MKTTKISVFKVVLICVLIGFVLGYFVYQLIEENYMEYIFSNYGLEIVVGMIISVLVFIF